MGNDAQAALDDLAEEEETRINDYRHKYPLFNNRLIQLLPWTLLLGEFEPLHRSKVEEV